jgi:hypothetical protein
VPKIYLFLYGRGNAMEENRFLRTYQEHKREKEQNVIKPNYDNRFECLRETRLAPVREGAGRFECLRSDITSSNRFSCLADDDYKNRSRQSERITYLPRSEPERIMPRSEPERVVYLPRPEPRESVNTQMKKYVEEKKALKPSTPVFSFESNYHFPELNKTPETPALSNMPKTIPELKLPEPKPLKDMIVTPIVIPNRKKISTVMFFKNGKLESKDVYDDDGTDVTENNLVILKRPTYTSWASVLKPESNDKVDYELEENPL